MTIQKPSTNLPDTIREACKHIGMMFYDNEAEKYYIDAEDGDPIGAFGFCEKGNQTYRRLIWLCMFVSRRAVPCWQLYCDNLHPQNTLQAIHDSLTQGIDTADWTGFIKPAVPSFMGEPIVDCRQCDTSEAAEAAAHAAKFLVSSDPYDARLCLASADNAFNQSPLGSMDHFREWLADFAAPIAYAEREMTDEEQNAYRTYQPDNVAWYSQPEEVLQGISNLKYIDKDRRILSSILDQIVDLPKKEYALRLLLDIYGQLPDEDELSAASKMMLLLENLPESMYDADLIGALWYKPSVFAVSLVDSLLNSGKLALQKINLIELLKDVNKDQNATQKVRLLAQKSVEKFENSVG